MVSEETTVPVFLSALITHHTPCEHYVMSLRGWPWKVSYSGSSLVHYNKKLLPLSRMSVVITHMSPACSPWSYHFTFCYMNCVSDFVNSNCSTWTQIQQFVEFHVDTDACFLCKSSQWFPWTCLQSSANFAQSFLTTCFLYVQFLAKIELIT
jgi:hypothetical protein